MHLISLSHARGIIRLCVCLCCVHSRWFGGILYRRIPAGSTKSYVVSRLNADDDDIAVPGHTQNVWSSNFFFSSFVFFVAPIFLFVSNTFRMVERGGGAHVPFTAAQYIYTNTHVRMQGICGACACIARGGFCGRRARDQGSWNRRNGGRECI